MQVNSLLIKNLYGFMDKEITFNSRISILVGINGSGKTSVLNILNWLLTLNINELCLIEFNNLKLDFTFEDEQYSLSCEQTDADIIFNLYNISKQSLFPRIRASFLQHPRRLTKSRLLKESLRGKYTHLRPEENELETWRFITEVLPSPTIIGLDRNLYTQEGSEIRIQDELVLRKRSINLEKISDSPIDKVKSELIKNFNTYRNSTINAYSSINRKIVLSAFDDIITDVNLTKLMGSQRPTINEIEKLHLQVKEFLKENQNLSDRKNSKHKDDSDLLRVDEYFKNLKNILRDHKNLSESFDILYLINVAQFKKLNDLVLEFKKYEEVTARFYKPLEGFLRTVNGFLKDSSKELYFDKNSSQIYFHVLDKQGRRVASNREIENLSSGEKQLLILLTYIKYNSHNRIFIIDEPELSLHPKWQSEFLDAIELLMPNEAQLILATHSPEIVGNNDTYYRVLLPYN